VRVLAIETSCDDTGAAVVLDGRKILSNVVSSQISVHQKYGGVVPELASRKHIESIVPIVTETLEEAHLGLGENRWNCRDPGPGPGRISFDRTLLCKVPLLCDRAALVGVNHIEAHLSAIFWKRASAVSLYRIGRFRGHTSFTG